MGSVGLFAVRIFLSASPLHHIGCIDGDLNSFNELTDDGAVVVTTSGDYESFWIGAWGICSRSWSGVFDAEAVGFAREA